MTPQQQLAEDIRLLEWLAAVIAEDLAEVLARARATASDLAAVHDELDHRRALLSQTEASLN